MNSDDIIHMALEHFGAVLQPSDLEVKLAVLAVAAEREACAKVCEKMADNIYSNSHEDSQPMPHAVAKFCAAAIRARGEA